jgi:hypothetical protein
MNNKKNPEENSIRHLPSGFSVRPIYYDRNSGEVSYVPNDSNLLFTCLDYELTSSQGINHLRMVLNNLPSNPLRFNSGGSTLSI